MGTKLQQLLKSPENYKGILYLEKDNLSGKDVGLLVEAIQNNYEINQIYLHDNMIGDQGIESLMNYMSGANISQLCLYNNKIGNEGAKFISKIIKNNNSLKHLHLAQNQIGDDGISMIAQAMINNKNITHLHLNSNEIGNIGLHSIIEMIKDNNTLTHLYLHYNKIQDTKITELQNALLGNTSITHIYLEKNYISDKVKKLFKERLGSKMYIEIDEQNNTTSLSPPSEIKAPLNSNHSDFPYEVPKEIINKSISEIQTIAALQAISLLAMGGWLIHQSSSKQLKAVITAISTLTLNKIYQLNKQFQEKAKENLKDLDTIINHNMTDQHNVDIPLGGEHNISNYYSAE